jgi:membrane protein DedA with SNARE-associated domain
MSTVLDWIVTVMRTIGAPGVGVATALESVFPPVPSELVLPFAG